MKIIAGTCRYCRTMNPVTEDGILEEHDMSDIISEPWGWCEGYGTSAIYPVQLEEGAIINDVD